MKEFLYFIDDIKLKNYKKIQIPKNIESKQELFDFYSFNLKFPTYFGNNWDAFNDVMCSLEIEENILLLHQDIPFEFSQKNQIIYVKLLKDFIDIWEKFKFDRIKIDFPLFFKNKIEYLLSIPE